MPARIHVQSLSSLAAFADAGGGADAAAQLPATMVLPPAATRHVQVLRLQPGSPLLLFDGQGGQWQAEVLRMGRSEVAVRLLQFEPMEREAPLAVHLAVCMPANDRMDDLVEKATELGAASITPLMAERSVLRLSGERALRKQQHWQAVAVAACEQCGRNRVPQLHPPQALAAWLAAQHDLPKPGRQPPRRLLLSLEEGAWPLPDALASWAEERGGMKAQESQALLLLSGPEGGFSPAESAQALAQGFRATSLGPRILRADTAALAATAIAVAWWEAAQRVAARPGP